MQKHLTELFHSVWETGHNTVFLSLKLFWIHHYVRSVLFWESCRPMMEKIQFFLKKKKKEKKESLFIKHAEEEFYEGITAKLCRSAPSPWRDTPALPQVEGLPTYILQEIHFQGLVCKMTYNAMTETKTFANPLYFQLLRQYFWELKLPLAAKPEPTIEQPEGHSDGVHDHLSLSALFVFLF